MVQREETVDFWYDAENLPEICNLLTENGDCKKLKAITDAITENDRSNDMLLRRRRLEKGPVLKGVKGFLDVPFVLEDGENLQLNCYIKTAEICLWGLVSLSKGYPLSGDYGQEIAELTVNYEDGEKSNFVLKNGVDVTTVFETNLSSKINPVAEKSKRLLSFGYNKNFERYVLNYQRFKTNTNKKIENITLVSKNNGYDLLIYGISY